MSEATPRTLRAVPLLVGTSLLAVYAAIGLALGYQAAYGPPLRAGTQWDGAIGFHHVSPGEARFWVAHLLLALPAVGFIAWGLAPRLGPALVRAVARIDRMDRREWQAAGLGFFLLLLLWSVIGRKLVLLGLPITDDENAVKFGARMVAEGYMRIPVLGPDGVFVQLFTYQRDGMVSSMDFPGVILFSAAGIVTHLGDTVYALASATSGVAVAYAAGRWFGPRGRVLAALIWCVSPMIASLSLTSHGHVPSRLFIALAIAVAARLDTESPSPRRDAVLFGLFAGLAFLCRPFESACVLTPIAALLAWRALRTRGLPRSAPLLALAGMVPSLVLFGWWNAQVTGVWYLQARFDGVIGGTPPMGWSVSERLGANLGWNLVMLIVFFLGVPAIVAVVAALGRKTSAAMVALAGGVVLHLALCLAHDDTGIHSVGPIHLSESVVPLVLLVTAGVVRGFAWLRERSMPRVPAAMFLAAYLVGWCGLFNVSNTLSLHRQAVTQQAPFELLEELGVHDAVVIAAPYMLLPKINYEFAPWGSWVLQYPHPDPFFRDDVIFVYPGVPIELLRQTFPERSIWALEYNRTEPAMTVGPVYLPPDAQAN